MATAQARMPGSGNDPERRVEAALRLFAAERTEEIYPSLLDEIVGLGYLRALVSVIDFEAARLRPISSINCGRGFQQRFTASLYSVEHAAVRILTNQTPKILEGVRRAPVYCHPVLYRNPGPCWEAGDDRSACLAAANQMRSRKVQSNDQLCAICQMRAYVGVVAIELPRNYSQTNISELSSLIEVANRLYARLYKTEHYYERMSQMDVTITQMQTVMESMSDPVILTDTKHRLIMQNKAAERFFTPPRNASEGRVRAVELNNTLFSAALGSMLVSAKEGSRDLTLVDTVEGEELMFEAVTAPSFARDGRRTGNVTVMRDVTKLRRADLELRRNFDRLRAVEEIVRQDRDRLNLIIENVGDPIIVCDKEANHVLMDLLAQELMGIGNEASRTEAQLRNETKLHAFVSAFTTSSSDRESAAIRLVQPTTGIEIEYDAYSGKIYDEQARVAYTVTVLRDLSAVRRVEQLKLERRMLEMEKFAVAGRLAGTIAHEVNNPLEAIKNCIFLLQKSIPQESAPIYGILTSETERVARIVRQMLGLYRSTEQVGQFDVNSVVEDTLLLFSRQLERAGITVQKKLGTVPATVGSADQLRQVLSNLIVNAKDSMSLGGVLHIRTHLHRAGGHEFIRLVVADTGCGIPSSMLQTIFEPFVSTKGERGTGLGLWIVKGIVDSHGGKLRVRSKVNHGTLFSIEIPVVR